MYPPTSTRPSILKLPKRHGSGTANQETSEREHARELARIQAKAHSLQRSEERLLQSIYALPHQSRMIQEETRQALDAFRDSRASEEAKVAGVEARWMAQQSTVPPSSDVPWSANVTTYRQSPDEEKLCRKELVAKDAVINRLAERQRALDSVRCSQGERAKQRHDLEAEVGWWNRGASDERWLPPELRIKRRGGGWQESDSPPGGNLIAARHSRATPARTRRDEGAQVAELLQEAPQPPASREHPISGRLSSVSSVATARYPWTWQDD